MKISDSDKNSLQDGVTIPDLSDRVWAFLKQSNLIEGVSDFPSLVDAGNAWEHLLTYDKLSHHAILHTHKILMLRQNGLRPDEKGYYRRRNVFVGNHIAPDWHYVENLMDNWLLDHMYLTPKEAYIRFEHIHPFVDGNGRVGRMLYNWQNLKANKDIHVILDRYKSSYYKWFQPSEKRQKEEAQNLSMPWYETIGDTGDDSHSVHGV